MVRQSEGAAWSNYSAPDGRFKRITGPGLPTYGVEYGRPADSELIEYARYKTDVDTTLVSTQRDYESNRDLIEWVENKVGDTVVSRYDYSATGDDLDALGRRTSVVYTGTAFAQNHLFKWGYNPRSELTTADRHQGTNPDSPGTQYTQYGDYEFAYDHIGNRQTYGLDANPDTSYTANDLNQYTGTSNPTEYLCYDEDGNLIRDGKASVTCPGTDGLREFKWDAENRLIEVIPISPASGAKKVKFVYDYMGRRVRKTVETYNGSSWPETSDELFVYHGWNIVMVINANASDVNATAAITRKYTWGLDLSGTIHGAGGIGGLLAAVETQGTETEADDQRYWFFHDANGNVGQVLDATNTGNITLAAHYEYDPYGNVIGPDPDNDGDWQEHATAFALANPFRFSTKWFDAETTLGYWGYRYYRPDWGRWTSNDPIGEIGGEHLLAFSSNRPTSLVDTLGLWPWSNPQKPACTCERILSVIPAPPATPQSTADRAFTWLEAEWVALQAYTTAAELGGTAQGGYSTQTFTTWGRYYAELFKCCTSKGCQILWGGPNEALTGVAVDYNHGSNQSYHVDKVSLPLPIPIGYGQALDYFEVFVYYPVTKTKEDLNIMRGTATKNKPIARPKILWPTDIALPTDPSGARCTLVPNVTCDPTGTKTPWPGTNAGNKPPMAPPRPTTGLPVLY